MSEKNMLYKICPDEQGQYVDARGQRCHLLVCHEVVFPAEETLDGQGNVVQSRVPTPQEKGYFAYPSLEAALTGLGLTQAGDSAEMSGAGQTPAAQEAGDDAGTV